MTDNINGSDNTPALLKAAGERYQQALIRSRTLPSGELALDTSILVSQSAINELTLTLVVDVLIEHTGLDPVKWRKALAERFNAQSALLEAPKIAVAPAGTMRRS